MNENIVESDPFLDFLQSIAGQQVFFFPHAGNAGDSFIAHSTYELCRRFNIQVTPLLSSETVAGGTVLVGGGGNLLEGRYGEVEDILLRHLGRNRCVLLPHSIYGHKDLVSRASDEFWIFCREKVSHALVLAAGADPRFTKLCHDLAFYCPPDLFDQFKSVSSSGSLTVMRSDGESARAMEIAQDNLDISLTWNGDLWHNEALARCVTWSLAAYLAPFESVESDRLHVSIIAAMMGKNVTMYPNSYFKNRAVFQHSIATRFPQVRFINTGTDIPYSDHVIGERDYLLEKIKRLEIKLKEVAGDISG